MHTRRMAVNFLPIYLTSRSNDVIQIDVDVREKAMAVPRGR